MARKKTVSEDPEHGLVNEDSVLRNFKTVLDSGLGIPPKPTKEEKGRSRKESERFRKGVEKALKNYEKTGLFSGKKRSKKRIPLG